MLFLEKLEGKSILSTMKYIRLIHFEDNEFEVTPAPTVEEAKQILNAEFDYVTERKRGNAVSTPKKVFPLWKISAERWR